MEWILYPNLAMRLDFHPLMPGLEGTDVDDTSPHFVLVCRTPPLHNDGIGNARFNRVVSDGHHEMPPPFFRCYSRNDDPLKQ